MVTNDCITVVVGKAQQVATSEPVADAAIQICGLTPEFRYLPDWDLWADDQAKQIEQVLIGTLPGGVYDRLLGHMLARKASHFRVAHREVNNG